MTEPSLERRRLLRTAAGLALGGAALAVGGWDLFRHGRSLYRVRRERTLMHTSVAVNVLADDVEGAQHAIEAAFAAMVEAAAVLTRFDAASPVARLNREGVVQAPPPMLRAVLERALDLSRRSEGDFDITVAPVLDYYLKLERPVVLSPADRDAVHERERLVDWRQLRLEAQAVRLLRPSMAITLDGIAKGFVVDQGIAALKAAGIEYGLIDAGGEVHAIAGNDPNRHWNVGIVDPWHTDRLAATVRLHNAGLSTSGNYEVFFSADRRLFHIINPHTGRSPDRYASVTMMARTSVDADGASVAAFSMDRERLAAFAEDLDQQWLVCAWNDAERWRSRHLPLVAGQARIA